MDTPAHGDAPIAAKISECGWALPLRTPTAHRRTQSEWMKSEGLLLVCFSAWTCLRIWHNWHGGFCATCSQGRVQRLPIKPETNINALSTMQPTTAAHCAELAPQRCQFCKESCRSPTDDDHWRCPRCRADPRWRKKRICQEAWKQRHRCSYLAQKRDLAHRPEYLARRRAIYAERQAAKRQGHDPA